LRVHLGVVIIVFFLVPVVAVDRAILGVWNSVHLGAGVIFIVGEKS
jgi:hypothetical protein